jgi:hypothetical protein
MYSKQSINNIGAIFDGIFNDTGGQQGTAKLIPLKKGYNGRLIFGETFN